MICIVGDTHGVHEVQKLFSYYDRFEGYISSEDCFIILGDFALPYYPSNDFQNERELRVLEELEKLKCKILIIEGNHEYFDYLYKCDEIDMFGSKVGKIRNNIYHLKRGNIYTIEDRTFFTFGGARSIDKDYQVSKGTWDYREVPSLDELKTAVQNLKKVNYKVDYILTHTAPNLVFKQSVVPIKLIQDFHDPVMDMLDIFYKKVQFRNWYCGHYHIDYTFDNFNFVFNTVRNI